MRKTIYALSIITVIGLTGCSKADIEKRPVPIADDTLLGETEETPEVFNNQEEEDVEEKKEDNEDIESKEREQDIEKELKEDVENEKNRLEEHRQREEDKVKELEQDAKNKLKEYEQNEKNKETEKINSTPEPMEIEIEGMKETINALWYQGEHYKIAYDADRFQYSDKDGADTFIAENPDPAIYPYVYLTIKYHENKTVSEYAKEISDQLSQNDFKVSKENKSGMEKNEGVILTAISGKEWNSIVRKYYIIQEGTSIYVFEAQYFLEAAEGYGARIHAMINTFEVK